MVIKMSSKHKGFTLIELLAVIAILGILMTIGVTSVFRIMNSQREALLKEQIKSLEDTAVTYAIDQKYFLNNCGVEVDVTRLTKDTKYRGCFKEIKVADIIGSGFFENKNDLCDTTKKVYVYKISSGTSFELRGYVPDEVCSY